MSTFKKTDKVTKLTSKKKRTASSRQWLLRQLNDPFVAKAKKEGYRSRAAFKLLEIQDKYRLIKKGSRVLDLGAAPGGWCQVATKITGDSGVVIGVDLTEIVPLAGVHFIQGDFLDETIQNAIIDAFKGHKAHVIISDMAAKACGMPDVDHLRLMDLLENAFLFALNHLENGGCFVAKVLRGGTEQTLLKSLKQCFSKVTHFKPNSSRAESAELYMVATGFKISAAQTLKETVYRDVGS